MSTNFREEAHAHTYISRWFESLCLQAKPDFARFGAAR